MMVEGLQRFTILEGLTPEESETILQRCQITTVKKGEKVIKAGESAYSLFLVRSGRIELRFQVVYFNAAVEVPLDIIRAGGVCGWSALIPPNSYTLTAYATEDSELLQIQQSDLQACCEANTRLGYLVMKNIARIVGERYEIARQILTGEIQRNLEKKENKKLWKSD
jgi:signal-transduction protein with cAMP-binding, CBS, and nucleotidyltransferase domain